MGHDNVAFTNKENAAILCQRVKQKRDPTKKMIKCLGLALIQAKLFQNEGLSRKS